MSLIKGLIRKISMSYSSKKLKFSFIMMILIAILLGISGEYIGVGKTTETGETIKMLDVMFNRSEAATYTQIKAYGVEGREIYLYSTLILDSIFPMAFGTFLTLLLVNLYKKSKYHAVILTPLSVVFTDYAENILTAIMLTNYPERLHLISYTGSLCTSFKWILMAIVILLIARGFIIKKREGRKARE
jgi:hypothetical protein